MTEENLITQTPLEFLMHKKEVAERVNPDAKIELQYEPNPEEKAKLKVQLRECYDEIIRLMKIYIDTKEENYKIISLWIMGTYYHDRFNTFPFLFLNAMRGSGKTRLLKFIAALAKNADIMADLKEAVLFRTAKGHTLLIDEFEHINQKDKGILRELLNAAYKKGIKVKRMKKVSEKGQEKQVVEEFDLYTPVVMANINGMDEVLNDRCINIILEKSHAKQFTKITEDFDFNPTFKQLVGKQCSLCSVVMLKKHQEGLITAWNDYVIQNNYTTLHTTYTTTNYIITQQEYIFKKIYESDIDGRSFELMFPLLMVAQEIGVFDDILGIATKLIHSKREDEFAESKDVSLYDFVASLSEKGMIYFRVKELVQEFRQFLGNTDDDERWLNDKWMGRALKRLNLEIDKKRVANGVRVMLNYIKAQEKIKMFKHIDNGNKSNILG